jgi:hypothetical protein
MVSRKSVRALVGLFLWGAGPQIFGQASDRNQIPLIRPDTYDFGTHEIGSRTSPVTVTLSNPNGSGVKVKFAFRFEDGGSSNRNDFQIENETCKREVDAGGSCAVQISFSPMGIGDRKGALQATYSVSGGTSASLPPVTLQGSGVLPELVISSTEVCFPPQKVATMSTPQTITLTNHSANPVTINRIVASGDFVLETPKLPQTLKPDETAVAMVSFNPAQEGSAFGMLTILSSAHESPQDVHLSGRTLELMSELCTASRGTEILLILVLCFTYWLAMVIVRWNRVARPTRELLKAEINSLRAKLETISADDKTVGPSKIKGLLDAASSLIDNTVDPLWRKAANFLFWSRGQEITGWGYLHEAEIQMTPFLRPETVTARLERSEQQLRILNDAPSLALANAIHQELTSPQTPVNLERRGALLAEALNSNYQREDNDFADLVSWQNKTSWLVGCGLVLILVLTAAVSHHSILFLVGATGGMISRLSRSLDRKDVPTDYGASWTTLFLSPVAGALGAWAGILLSGLAVQLNILGPVFKIDWSSALCQPTTLGIALVFGFSERLLDGVLDKLVEKTGAAQATAANPQPLQQTTSGGPAGNAASTAELTIPEQTLGNAKVGQDYTAQLRASGAGGDISWAVQAGSSLPIGLQLTPDGKITGKPAAAGTFTFAVEVSGPGTKASRVFTITTD